MSLLIWHHQQRTIFVMEKPCWLISLHAQAVGLTMSISAHFLTIQTAVVMLIPYVFPFHFDGCHLCSWSYHPFKHHSHSLIRCYYHLLLCRNSSQCLKLHIAAWFVPFVEWVIEHLAMICIYYINFHYNNFSNTLPVITAVVTMDLLPMPCRLLDVCMMLNSC